jgi:hypothetical protein
MKSCKYPPPPLCCCRASRRRRGVGVALLSAHGKVFAGGILSSVNWCGSGTGLLLGNRLTSLRHAGSPAASPSNGAVCMRFFQGFYMPGCMCPSQHTCLKPPHHHHHHQHPTHTPHTPPPPPPQKKTPSYYHHQHRPRPTHATPPRPTPPAGRAVQAGGDLPAEVGAHAGAAEAVLPRHQAAATPGRARGHV